ncbi:MAG: nucleotide exchange factor GrpE [Pseudomonadota bacterium]
MSDKEDLIEEEEELLEKLEPETADEEAENLTIESLQLQLDEARATIDESALRARADMENFQRRHKKELEKAHKFALDNFSSELLPVWDSLELGIQAALDHTADVDKLREGNELTLKMLRDVMNKFGIEQIDPEGEAFNPEEHQAMSMQPSDEVPPNTVTTVVQRGYKLNGRLIRPAMVMVSQ